MAINEGLKSIFFGDQDVYEEDLNNIEYTKIRTFRKSLAACLQQPGVAIESLSDLALKVVSGSVNPGVAIDSFGRLIYVPSDTSASGSTTTDPYYHPVWPSCTYGGGGDYVNIYYNTQQDIIETDDSGVSHYTRIYDSYIIIAEGSLPSSDSGGICLSSGGIDCRPLLKLKASVVPLSVVDEAWIKAVQASSTLNQISPAIYWIDTLSGTRKKAEVAYKHIGGSSMDITFSVYNASSPGTFQVDIYDSLTEAVVITNSVNFSAGAGQYTLSLPISSLSTTSLYFIRITIIAGTGTTYINYVIVNIT